MARFIQDLKRTHMCGELRASDNDSEVVLMGWVQNRRDHGGCVFIDLRDRDGLTQIVFDPCQGISCSNRGQCIDGSCICDAGSKICKRPRPKSVSKSPS